MLYLVDGQPKSGSTFLFRLVEHLVRPKLDADDLQGRAGERVFHRRPGESSCVPFIVDHGAFASEVRHNEEWNALLADRDAVFKLHRGSWLVDAEPDFSLVHFFSYRNVLDAALALLEQGERESSRPPERQRPAFLRLNDPEKALRQAIHQFRDLVVPALTDERIVCFAYPDFIQGDPNCCRRIAEACRVDSGAVLEGIRLLDRKVRHGKVQAEFGTGIPGRGVAQKGRFPARLVDEAEGLNAEFGL